MDHDPSPHLSLNLRVRGIPPSATIAINERADKMRALGKDVCKLGLGQSPFPVPESVVEALRRNAHQKDYLPVRGLPALRETLAAHYSAKFGMAYSPDDVLIGPGSKELMFLLQLAYYGDLLIPTPAWVSYAPQAKIIGRQVLQVQTSRKAGWKLTAERIDAICAKDPTRPRLIILNYPSNPTGSTYTHEELHSIAEVARRYGVILLSDEIYGRLHHEGAHCSIVPLYPEGTIYSGGLSKWCGAGGWRLGFFLFPAGLRPLADAMAAVASETFTSTSAPIQYAAVAAFQPNPEIDLYLQRGRLVLKSLGRWAARRLRAAGAKVDDPEGGFYLFPSFSSLRERFKSKNISTSASLCEAILEETGVAVLPGSVFGRPARELTMRIAYVNFNGAKALEVASRHVGPGAFSEAMLREACLPTMECVDRLCGWFEHHSA